MSSTHVPGNGATRRQFLKTSAALTAASMSVVGNAYAKGNDLIKVGLIGCGGRGTGAAQQAMEADPNVKLWAMADAFDDRLQSSLERLKNNNKIAAKIDVAAERQFTGFDGYKNVINACDVVLLCTPPHFRPIHLRAAVDAGKHVFAEKPCAVDGPGVRSVLESCQAARAKNLCVVAGLCLRSDFGFRDTVRRIHDGAIGDIVALQANDLRGRIWTKVRDPQWSEMTWQMKNWYYYTWLSGDFNVEQHVHFLDVCAWVMKDNYPARCYGTGGRQVRTGQEYGQIYDHFAIVYEYDNGTRIYSTCRQQPGCKNDISGFAMGRKGTAVLSERRRGLIIKTDNNEHVYNGPSPNMYQVEHDEMFAAIRAGRTINNGEYMAKSTLMAIQARMAAYTGDQITWEKALNSQEKLSPAEYTWDAAPPPSSVAMPGVTRFS